MQVIDHAALAQRLRGIVPPLAMPFGEDGKLRLSGLAGQIELMVGAGVAGVVVGGSTGEGHTLSFEEHVAAARAAHDTVAGRVAFLAGLIVNSTQEAIRRAEALRGLEITALQITPVHYLFKPSRRATIEHFRAIHEASGLPILIYNVIPWNYLDVDHMLEIMAEVPGVIGIKQSGGDLKSVSDLLLGVTENRVVLSGVDALLYPNFAIGGHGAISALTCAVPAATVALWDAVQQGDHATAREIHQRLGRLWNALSHDNLPACVKYIHHRQGLPLHAPRAPMEPVSAVQRAAIDALLPAVLEMAPTKARAA